MSNNKMKNYESFKKQMILIIIQYKWLTIYWLSCWIIVLVPVLYQSCLASFALFLSSTHHPYSTL